MANRSICILYGLNEGPTMGKQLAQAFEQAGFTLSHDPTTADIIFAHSGGCFLIPPNNRAKLVVLIGLSYWPDRRWIVATTLKVWREATTYYRSRRLLEWGRKWLHHIRYVSPRAAWQMYQNQSFTKPWNSSQPQVIIRNQYDEYCHPDIASAPFNGARTFVSLPGEHDDCWDHPKVYVDLIQSLGQQEGT